MSSSPQTSANQVLVLGFGAVTAIGLNAPSSASAANAGLANLASDQGQNDVPRMNDDYFDRSAFEDPSAYLAASAVSHLEAAKTPTLIVHGEKDERAHW